MKNIKTDERCPECGPNTRLIVRVSRKGRKFLGCENYPKCKHTKTLPEYWNMKEKRAPQLF